MFFAVREHVGLCVRSGTPHHEVWEGHEQQTGNTAAEVRCGPEQIESEEGLDPRGEMVGVFLRHPFGRNPRGLPGDDRVYEQVDEDEDSAEHVDAEAEPGQERFTAPRPTQFDRHPRARDCGSRNSCVCDRVVCVRIGENLKRPES
jgi:hypothetical protein